MRRFSPAVFLTFTLAMASACGHSDSSTSAVNTCSDTSGGTPWVPNVAGASASNHDGSNVVTKTVINASGPVLGLGDPVTAAAEIDVPIDMTQDLGASGSLSLVASVGTMPSQLSSGGIYPVLMYLSDGTHDFINLARAGTSGDCRATGVFTCTSGTCDFNPGCITSWPSAYYNQPNSTSPQDLWAGHQFPLDGMGYNSVNTFPNCNWPDGTTSGFSATTPGCAFNSTFFSAPTGTGAKLKTGTYHAKYALIASDYSSTAGAGVTASFTVSVIKKSASHATVGGTVDLNIVLVGDKNVIASRTDKGKQNLDALVTTVSQLYSQSTVNVKLGSVNAYEWPCSGGGQSYAAADINALGTMFQAGNSLIPAATEGKALNIFLVSTIGEVSSGFTTLGLSAGIGGTMLNGTQASGLVFASFDKLDTYNPNCTPGTPCPTSSQESAFVDMGATIAHEMGHYLGLSHPSERDGTVHDMVYDTPTCSTLRGGTTISINSCLNGDISGSNQHANLDVYPVSGKTCYQQCSGYNSLTGSFCPTVPECQFNHTMWWSSKFFNETTGTGDGNLFSTDSGIIINYNPFIQ